MVQTHQGLQAAELSIPGVERLVVQLKSAVLQSAAKMFFELRGFQRGRGNLLRDIHVLVAAGFFRAVHRRVRVAPEDGWIGAVVRIDRDAEACRQVDVDAVVTVGLVQPPQYVGRDALGIFRLGDLLQEYGEFFATVSTARTREPRRRAISCRHTSPIACP
jgi:hypothetical protein